MVQGMASSPETLVGAALKGVFAPPSEGARAAQSTVQFELKRFVGAGKFAWVYEARTLAGPAGFPPRVAVKILYRDDAQALKRFQREIKVMRQLPQRPNNVTYLGHGTHDKQPWVAMDFVDGFTLAAVLRAQKPISERAACLLMTQLCDGFEVLHRLGLTHRDITPENIMLTQADRQVKLMDFGLVQDSQGLLQLYEQVDILDGADFNDDLDAGLIAGTPEFMAPEQILDPHEKDRHRQKTDTTADVFALGTIFYQLVSGTQLFPYERGARGATGKQALINYLDYRVRLEDEDLVCPSMVGAELWSIIRKSLSRDPRHRQRDASELGADIRYYLETGQGVAEDDMSATISTTMDALGLKSLVGKRDSLGLSFPTPPPKTPEPPALPVRPTLQSDQTVPTGLSRDNVAELAPGFPDAPLVRPKTRSHKTLGLVGPGTEKPTRVEGDAPSLEAISSYSKIEQSKVASRRWLWLAAGGLMLVALGAGLAFILV
jgi:serine/threonine protein kinase